MKEDLRGKVIEFLDRAIPRTKNGDPDFQLLCNKEWDDLENTEVHDYAPAKESLLSVFTPEEIVLLCNRAIYQMEYGREWHRKWERRKREELQPLKEKVCSMFGLRKWTEASEDQLRQAKEELEKEKTK